MKSSDEQQSENVHSELNHAVNPQPDATQQTAKMVHNLRQELEAESEIDAQISSHEPGFAARQVHRMFNWFSKVNTQEVSARVAELRQELPQATQAQLIEQLIKRKCEHTARIGAATAATGSIPILGTVFSLTLGMILDLGAVITSQAELVLEIAEVYGVKMSEAKKRETVFLVLGLGVGAQRLGARASQQVLHKLATRYARRWISHAIPVLGIAAAAAINALSTYLIGRRAQAYFGQGPSAMGDWKTSLRALSGYDELKVSEWLQGLNAQHFKQTLTEHLPQNISQFSEQLTPEKLSQHLPVQMQSMARDVLEKGKGFADQALEYGQQTLERMRTPHASGQSPNTAKVSDKQAEDQQKPEKPGSVLHPEPKARQQTGEEKPETAEKAV